MRFHWTWVYDPLFIPSLLCTLYKQLHVFYGYLLTLCMLGNFACSWFFFKIGSFFSKNSSSSICKQFGSRSSPPVCKDDHQTILAGEELRGAWYQHVIFSIQSCADPGIFVRGGGPGQSDKKKLWQCFVFLCPQLIFQKSNGQFQSNLSIFQGSRGGPTYSRGVQLFPGGGGGGVKLLIPYRNPYNLWFSRGGGGGRPPVPPSGSALDS